MNIRKQIALGTVWLAAVLLVAAPTWAEEIVPFQVVKVSPQDHRAVVKMSDGMANKGDRLLFDDWSEGICRVSGLESTLRARRRPRKQAEKSLGPVLMGDILFARDRKAPLRETR